MKYRIWKHTQQSRDIDVRNGKIEGGFAAVVDAMPKIKAKGGAAVIEAVDGFTRVADNLASVDDAGLAALCADAMIADDERASTIEANFASEFVLVPKASKGNFVFELHRAPDNHAASEDSFIGYVSITTADDGEYPEDAHHWTELVLDVPCECRPAAGKPHDLDALAFKNMNDFMYAVLCMSFEVRGSSGRIVAVCRNPKALDKIRAPDA